MDTEDIEMDDESFPFYPEVNPIISYPVHTEIMNKKRRGRPPKNSHQDKDKNKSFKESKKKDPAAELLYTAVLEQDAERVKRILLENPNNSAITIARSGMFKHTPLHLACDIGDVEIVKSIVDYMIKNPSPSGFDVHNNNGQTALDIADCNGYVEICDLLKYANNAIATQMQQCQGVIVKPVKEEIEFDHMQTEKADDKDDDDDGDQEYEQHKVTRRKQSRSSPSSPGSRPKRPRMLAKLPASLLAGKSKCECCHTCAKSVVQYPREYLACHACHYVYCVSCFKYNRVKGFVWEDVQGNKEWTCPVCIGSCNCYKCSTRGPPAWYGQRKHEDSESNSSTTRSSMDATSLVASLNDMIDDIPFTENA